MTQSSARPKRIWPWSHSWNNGSAGAAFRPQPTCRLRLPRGLSSASAGTPQGPRLPRLVDEGAKRPVMEWVRKTPRAHLFARGGRLAERESPRASEKPPSAHGKTSHQLALASSGRRALESRVWGSPVLCSLPGPALRSLRLDAAHPQRAPGKPFASFPVVGSSRSLVVAPRCQKAPGTRVDVPQPSGIHGDVRPRSTWPPHPHPQVRRSTGPAVVKMRGSISKKCWKNNQSSFWY